MELKEVFPVWKKLTPAQQEKLEAMSELRSVKAGTVLHDGGVDCLGLLLVSSGQLRAYILSEEGREITIGRFFEMDICIFSASCVMPNMQFNVVIEAEKDSRVWVIPACLYKNLMDESLAICSYSNDLMATHFTELMWLVEQVMWKSFDKRLAKFLVEESLLEETPLLKITHEKIANHMGTAREVVTRMLRYFQSEGLVTLTRGGVELKEERKLEKLAES